eukprot:Seg3562.10 transcript_id=Seg3562.10/GoldUCD/mRNA.D3Y31 product="hypothetical protein" protein_id=Seg3562.10/GoldUCD/D3Y31
MSFPSEQSANPFGGPPSAFHQLRQKSVALNPGPGPPARTIAGKTVQHYGEQTIIPTALYSTVMNHIKDNLENAESNESIKHIQLARQHANNPNTFKYHMAEADRYLKVANSKNINDLIRNKLTDSRLDSINAQINQLKTGKLNTPEAMKRLQSLQIEKHRRKDILMNNEIAAYNNYLTNPFNAMSQKPQTLPENHAQRNLTNFLKTHRDVIRQNKEGHLIIDGQTVSKNPHDVPALVHYMTKDIHGTAPPGVLRLVRAMRARHFDMKQLGNAFLKEHLKKATSTQTFPIAPSIPTSWKKRQPLKEQQHTLSSPIHAREIRSRPQQQQPYYRSSPITTRSKSKEKSWTQVHKIRKRKYGKPE